MKWNKSFLVWVVVMVSLAIASQADYTLDSTNQFASCTFENVSWQGDGVSLEIREWSGINQPKHYWAMDDSGTNVEDIISSLNGTFTGTLGSGATGQVNTAFEFDGAEDVIEVTTQPSDFKDESFSIGVWYYIDNYLPRYQRIFDIGNTEQIYMFINDDVDSLRFGQITSGTNDIWGFTTDFLDDKLNQWNHVFITYNSTSRERAIYHNGINQTIEMQSIGTGTATFVNKSLYIGDREVSTTTTDFDGSLDEFMYFDYLLSDSQISTIYNSQKGNYSGTLTCQNLTSQTYNNWTLSKNETSTNYINATAEFDSNGTLYSLDYPSNFTDFNSVSADNITLTFNFFAESSGLTFPKLIWSNVSTTASTINNININLTYPTEGLTIDTTNITFECNVSSIDTIQNVSLYIDGVLNETNITGGDNLYIFDKTLTEGSHNYTCDAYDNNSYLKQTAINFTIDLDSNVTNVLLESDSCTISTPFNLTASFSCIGDKNCSGNWNITDISGLCTLISSGSGVYNIEQGTSFNDTTTQYTCPASIDYGFNLTVSNNGDDLQYYNITTTCGGAGGGGLTDDESSCLLTGRYVNGTKCAIGRGENDMTLGIFIFSLGLIVIGLILMLKKKEENV